VTWEKPLTYRCRDVGFGCRCLYVCRPIVFFTYVYIHFISFSMRRHFPVIIQSRRFICCLSFGMLIFAWHHLDATYYRSPSAPFHSSITIPYFDRWATGLPVGRVCIFSTLYIFLVPMCTYLYFSAYEHLIYIFASSYA
jgi:hypothetical protein